MHFDLGQTSQPNQHCTRRFWELAVCCGLRAETFPVFLNAPPPHKPRLNQVSKNRVTHQHGGDKRPVEPRQRREAKRAASPRKRQYYTDKTDYNRGGDKRWTGSAFNKGNPGGTNYMDNELLCQKRFDEPSGLKQRWIVPCIENVEHYEKC